MGRPPKMELARVEEFLDWFEGHALAGRRLNADWRDAVGSIAGEGDTTEKRRERARKLEKECEEWARRFGVKLFVDSELTEEGILFFRRLRRWRDDYDALHAGRDCSTIHISTIDAGVHFWLPPVLADRNDNRSYRIIVREWWQVLLDVREGIVDLGIALTAAYPDVESEEFLSRQHVAVMTDKHRLSGEPFIELNKLGKETIVCLHKVSAPIGIPAHLKKMNPRLIVVQSSSQMLSFIRYNAGIGFLPEEMFDSERGIIGKPVIPELPYAQESMYWLPENAERTRDLRDKISGFWKEFLRKRPQPSCED